MPYPTRSQIGLNYPFIFPDTKLDPDKLSNLAIQNFSTLTLNQYPGYWYDFVFLWSDSVTKITGNHTFKAGVSVERSGMKDQIQLSAAAAPATTNQNGSFRFTDATRADGTGLAMSQRAARAVRRLHRVRHQAADQLHRHGLRLLRRRTAGR